MASILDFAVFHLSWFVSKSKTLIWLFFKGNITRWSWPIKKSAKLCVCDQKHRLQRPMNNAINFKIDQFLFFLFSIKQRYVSLIGEVKFQVSGLYVTFWPSNRWLNIRLFFGWVCAFKAVCTVNAMWRKQTGRCESVIHFIAGVRRPMIKIASYEVGL